MDPDFAEKLARRRLYSHVLAAETGMTLVQYLLRYPRFDAAGWRNAVLAGAVSVNDRPGTPETVLREHDCVAYFPGDLPEPEANCSFKIIYTDDFLTVLEKPADLCIHPTGPFFRHTLWHLAGRELGELFFVTRLDRETSGLCLAARSREMASRMDARVFPVHKEYLALVIGDFPEYLRAAGRMERNAVMERQWRFIPDISAVTADTELCRVCHAEPDMTLVRAVLHTGHKHQIRASLCSLGFPVVGDKLYGPDPRLYLKIRTGDFSAEDKALLRMNHQALHAAVLAFRHPVSGQNLRFASLPDWPLAGCSTAAGQSRPDGPEALLSTL